LQLLSILQVLLALANGTPVFAKKIFGQKFALPLEAGLAFFDERPVFGRSKALRGILLAILATTAAALLIGLDPSGRCDNGNDGSNLLSSVRPSGHRGLG
jgi:hypothetical protein